MASMAALAKINELVLPYRTKELATSLTGLMVSEGVTSTVSTRAARGGQRRRQANSGRQPERISLLQHSTSSQSELTTYHREEMAVMSCGLSDGSKLRLPDLANRCRMFREKGGFRTAWTEPRWNGSNAVLAALAKRGWWCCAEFPPTSWQLLDHCWTQPARWRRRWRACFHSKMAVFCWKIYWVPWAG